MVPALWQKSVLASRPRLFYSDMKRPLYSLPFIARADCCQAWQISPGKCPPIVIRKGVFMSSKGQQERAAHFRRLHHEAPLLVLPNVWDSASARVVAQAGFPAIATTSSGVATALGYSDGPQISREILIDALARITRVVECPVTADIEAGYGNSIDEVLQTVKAVIATGVVGINIEDSLAHQESALADISYQVELLQALRELASSLDVPFVINARVDVFLLAIGDPDGRFEHTVQRANAYLQAGADCIYPIAMLDRT